MVEARDERGSDEAEPSGPDVLTVALFAYFVLLIVVVGGLLVLPALS